jgi:hypothetical protein
MSSLNADGCEHGEGRTMGRSMMMEITILVSAQLPNG